MTYEETQALSGNSNIPFREAAPNTCEARKRRDVVQEDARRDVEAHLLLIRSEPLGMPSHTSVRRANSPFERRETP